MVTKIESLKSLRQYGERSTPGDKCMHCGNREKERFLGTVIPAKAGIHLRRFLHEDPVLK